MDSAKKTVLFICPAFFDYEQSIKEAIISNDMNVDYFDERTSNHSIFKALFRLNRNLLQVSTDRYYKKVLNAIRPKKYDFLFVIKGEVVPEWFILQFKTLYPDAKLVYYTYDSFNNNNKHSQKISKLFDVRFSFDFEDVKKDPSLRLKHLFYTADFEADNEKPKDRIYDLSFVGTLHSNRYNVLKKISAMLNNVFVFYYMPAKWFFYFEKAFKKDFKKVSISEISFNKLSKKNVADIFKASKSVLDIQRFGQTGLTMRTFEVLASGSILITTNQYVKQADFYDEDRIIVLEDLNNESNIALIRKKIGNYNYVQRPFGLEKYYINNWIKEFFE